MARVPDVKQIKSAKRVLAVLEFFNESRQEATVMDIVRAYGYPQSSTSELLSCLVELGFLNRDRSQRTYRPTAKVAVLGAWTYPRLFRHGKLLKMMDTLAAETGCTVFLAGAVGVAYEFYHTVFGSSIVRSEDGPGILTKGPVGRLLLSTHDRSDIRKVVHRLNSETDESQRVRCEDLLMEVDQIRKQGFATSSGLAEGLGGVIAVRLPRHAADEVLVLGMVVGQGDRRGCAYHLRALNDAIATILEPAIAPIREQFAGALLQAM